MKMSLLKCLVWPVVMYGCEAWTLRKEERDRLNAAEMWFYRRLLRVSWKDMRTNESILEELSTNRVLMQQINRRKMRYLGHAVRNPKTNLMATILQGRVEGKRNRGRPQTLYMDNVTAISGFTLAGMMHRSRNQEDWRTVVARSEAATDEHGDADR